MAFAINKLNFKQPKYIIPLITMPFALFISYNLNQFGGKEEAVKVEELSTNLGNAEEVEDIFDKGKAYDNAYQMQKDQGTALATIDEESDSLAFYKDNMTPAQRRQMDSIKAMKKMQRELENSRIAANAIKTDYYNPNNRTGRSFAGDTKAREDQDYNRNMKLLEAINSDNTEKRKPSRTKADDYNESPDKWRKEQLRLMREQMMFADSLEKSKDPEFIKQQLLQKMNAANNKKKRFYLNSSLKVTKDNKTNHFNSFYRENNESFIKAIVDENLKGYMGSRLKLRLLDDIYIGNLKIDKGTPLFALITGFDSQRVKLSVVSVLYKNQILPINLNIYDIDGMEGLYVPASQFREMTREMGTNLVQGQQLNNGNSDFFGNMLTSLYQSSSQTISKVLRENKVKVKYNTHIYLIDNSEMDKRRQEIYKNNQ
ncbi:conjugative transposon protein TraM [Chryseobacterium antibioticum]|uniref:Conjugative transposon protein TraM n=1 Tax=Chryseobacterium pyrolae TaxID=2987481 RepID=A0ABT2IMZ6_9FLAO|nr:conjugative transposon protein TraM [Chryseobacterium pyrolae]MCT2409996.1 conjugative transposon protein TraM [Chryseobacterium pyrolae]